MYSVFDYGRMLADGIRTGAYIEAMEAAISPGDVVMDIGTGTGFFAVAACELGAARVYAIEPDDSVLLAQQMVTARGLQDRVRVVRGMSTDIKLTEEVDLIVADLRGTLPAFNGNLASMIDARDRFLRPGGTLLPKRDRLFVGLAFIAKLEADLAVWTDRRYGIDLQDGLPFAANAWPGYTPKAEDVFTEGRVWSEIDYRTIQETKVAGRAEWQITTATKVNSIALWFEAELADEISYSTAPDLPELVYGRGSFPLLRTVELAAGDVVHLELSADQVANDYVWRWNTDVVSAAGDVRFSFKQSTFLADARSAAELQLRAASHSPTLGPNGEIDYFVMSRMDGGHSVEDISRALLESFPGQFETEAAAQGRVGDIAVRYSERYETGTIPRPGEG